MTIVAVVVVVAAEVAATLGATAANSPRTHHAVVVGARSSPPLYGGEPRILAGATAPAAARSAAIKFVGDYALWSDGRLRTIPAADATQRVIRLLEQQPKDTRLAAGNAAGSVRIAGAGRKRYIVTSAIGNFLVGREGACWLVVSVPGD